MIWTFFKLIKKKISSSYCPIVTVIRIGCLRFFFSFVHCWFFEESNSVEITLNTFLRLLYKYMVQKLLDLTRALFITTKIHTPRWRLQKFKGNFYFRNHIKRATPRTVVFLGTIYVFFSQRMVKMKWRFEFFWPLLLSLKASHTLQCAMVGDEKSFQNSDHTSNTLPIHQKAFLSRRSQILSYICLTYLPILYDNLLTTKCAT